MIILVTTKIFNPKTNRTEVVISHGVDYDTFKNIVLPSEDIAYYKTHCGAYEHPEHGLVMDS